MPQTRIGTSPTDYWLYSPETGYDVSRGAPAEATRSIATHKGNVKLAVGRSALIIIDMQNIFLHPEIREHKAGLAAMPKIIDAVKASRAAGVKVIWVNWGLTEEEVESMPPGLAAGFTVPMPSKLGKPRVYGLDMEINVDGFDAGRILMRDQWNTRLYGPLEALWKEGNAAGTDVWINKSEVVYL
ncbi:Isochorismatase hydrolase [Pseudohyphozyma bogoriensis]|nr:Isochorismatase hydrolase [Pseudohyphozyma bogoriensis]